MESVFQEDWIISSLELTENARKLLHYIKYQKRSELFRLLIPSIPSQLPWILSELTLVPVPLSVQRFYQRGFNQSEWLARQLSKNASLPVETRGLIKVKETPPQSTLDREQRTENLVGAFQWQKRIHVPRNVCLIDDVLTTGETLKACKSALLEAGVQGVVGWTLFSRADII